MFIKREGNTCKINKLGELETVSRIMPQGFNFVQQKGTFVKDIIHLIHHVEMYELVYNDNHEALKMISSL